MSVDTNSIREILLADPVWSAYALADLSPDLLPMCRWTVAGDGLVLVFTGLEPPILLTVGEPDAVAQALAQAELPEEVHLSVQEEHLSAVEVYYRIDAYQSMVRMTLGQETELSTVALPVIQLAPQDEGRVLALFVHGGPFAPDGFASYQLADGFFFGIEDSAGGLNAVGGTHVLNRQEGVAAIGNVYTRPDCRGKGYARAITAQIVSQLRAEGLPLIVLNVNSENSAARRLYDSLGFVEHCSFVEGIVRKRSA